MNKSGRKRYAMIGGGLDAFIGQVHRRAAALDGTGELVAGALSSTPARSRESGEALGLAEDRIYPTWRELVEAEGPRAGSGTGVDWVTIVTPNDSHYEIARACLEAGLDVVIDKPMTRTSEEAASLEILARERGKVCAVTYNYTGYPMVRRASELVRSGAIGEVRKVFAEYHQGWLATPIEQEGVKQAAWRTDPARAGLGGALGDIGTHAEHLVRFVTGLEVDRLCADLRSFVPGRTLDDDASVLIRYRDGASGVLTCSQVCVGRANGLSLRLYGSHGGIAWNQEDPELLHIATLDGCWRTERRGLDGLGERVHAGSRIPPGHPEGFIEAFANIYRGVARAIDARREGTEPGTLGDDVPTARDGRIGVRFVELCVESAEREGTWVEWS